MADSLRARRASARWQSTLVSLLGMLIVPGFFQPSWAQEEEQLLGEARSLAEVAHRANSDCDLEKRWQAYSQMEKVKETFLKKNPATHQLQQMIDLLSDTYYLAVPSRCQPKVGYDKPPGYRSPERRLAIGQGESYTQYADRLHAQAKTEIENCDLERARSLYSDLRSLHYDSNRLRASTMSAPREADRQTQAAIEHITNRFYEVEGLLQVNEKRCAPIVAERAAQASARRSREYDEYVRVLERALADAEAARARSDCRVFRQAAAFAEGYMRDFRVFLGMRQDKQQRLPDEVYSLDDRIGKVKGLSCDQGPEPKPAITASPWGAPSGESPWDRPNPYSPWSGSAAAEKSGSASVKPKPAASDETLAVQAAAPAGTVELDWQRDEYGLVDSVTYFCPPNPGRRFSAASLIGTDRYLRKSTVCVAAAHAGVISPERGGKIRLKFYPGKPGDQYVGSERNGITSGSWDRAWGGFSVHPAEGR